MNDEFTNEAEELLQDRVTMTRRQAIKVTALTGAAIAAAQFGVLAAGLPKPLPIPANTANASMPAPADIAPQLMAVELQINGKAHSLTLDTRTTLLDTLRESLGLTGTKKGCDHGQCGACTVLIDGRRANACLALAVMLDGTEITTIEGLSKGDQLHPMQQAFLTHDGFQCGYCTPGQICSSVGMLNEAAAGMHSHVTSDLSLTQVTLTDDEIRERMSGNLCRCSAYPNIVNAIREVSKATSGVQS